MYLVVDLMGDYKSIMDYKDIRDLLIEEVVRDLKENIKDKDLEKENINNIGLLERLAREKDTPLSYIEKELECYSFKIINLQDLHRDLYDLKEYVDESNCMDKTLETIEKIMNER